MVTATDLVLYTTPIISGGRLQGTRLGSVVSGVQMGVVSGRCVVGHRHDRHPILWIRVIAGDAHLDSFIVARVDDVLRTDHLLVFRSDGVPVPLIPRDGKDNLRLGSLRQLICRTLEPRDNLSLFFYEISGSSNQVSSWHSMTAHVLCEH